MFYRVPAFLGATLLLLVISQGPATADEFIRIATFNIANLGDRDEYSRSLIALTNIVLKTEADLVAIQEVEPNQLGQDQVERLVDLLNVASAHYGMQPYTHAISPEHIGDETTAFVWRNPVELLGEIELLSHDADPDGDGLRTFQRVPSIAPFRAGTYDFLVVNCHLYTKVEGVSSEGRRAELEVLAIWLRSLPSETEKDAVVLGDFNRFLNDSSRTTWTAFMPFDHEQHY